MKLRGDGGDGRKLLSEGLMALSGCHKLDQMKSTMKHKGFPLWRSSPSGWKRSFLSLSGLWCQERFLKNFVGI